MIQKTNPPIRNTAVGPSSGRQSASNDGPEVWGQWSGRKHYSLEVVQHPIRARMCGFGDKDRRPLAPAAVAKMIVRREDGKYVDVDEIDCSFFLVTVDLWSADGKHEMNLVLHPTSADRYVPSSTPKSKRRGTLSNPGNSGPSQKSSRQSETPAPSANPTPYPPQQPSSGMTPYMQPPNSGYPSQGYPFPPQSAGDSSFSPITPYQSQPEGDGTWGYPPSSAPTDRAPSYGPPPVPNVQPMARDASPPATKYPPGPQAPGAPAWPPVPREDEHRIDFRTWPSQPAYPPLDPTTVPLSNDPRDSYGNVADVTGAEPYPQAHARYASSAPPEPYTPVQTSPTQPPPVQQSAPGDSTIYASASYAQQQHQQQQAHAQPQAQASYHPQGPSASASYAESTPPSTIPPLPRHTYTRTLVGPLAANACRLLDEHRKPGIFFLFQDLSIRTEGTFRLRLRLMNVGAPPAPEPKAPGVHTSVSPVLAQVFTEPFVVFSAKRFPGVPDTTALSIALGNQGQKLPLRNRHGSSKQGRKRRRSGSDGSGDDSDDA